MNDVLNVEVRVKDVDRTFYVKIDTIKNSCTIYTVFDEPKYDHHIETESSLLVDLVNELKDVEVDGKIIDGNKALELTENDRFPDVLKGIIRSIGKKNLFLTITSLFSKLKKKLKTDIPINRIIKLIMSETVDLDAWNLEIIKEKKDA
ncbi:MAG: hypothetical protein J6Z03_06380 [Erysipelotrichaceae bacterium]|nr:hypothetical protein [Erysipelotrichaceae bacterium]